MACMSHFARCMAQLVKYDVHMYLQNETHSWFMPFFITQWVTLCFAKTKVLNSSFKPKLNLDTKIQFQTNAQFDFGLKPSFKLGLKPSFRSTAILKKLT